MRYLLIDPETQTVTEGEAEPLDRAALHKLIGCETTDPIRFGEGVAFVDGDGFGRGRIGVFRCDLLYPDPLAGRCVVTGPDYRESGTLRSTRMEAEALRKQIKWLGVRTVRVEAIERGPFTRLNPVIEN